MKRKCKTLRIKYYISIYTYLIIKQEVGNSCQRENIFWIFVNVFRKTLKTWCQVCIVKHMRDIISPFRGMTQNKPVE